MADATNASPNAARLVGSERGKRNVQILLPLILLYYWACLYLQVLLPPPEESAWTYALLVTPIALAASIGLLANLARGRYSTASDALAAPLLLLIAVATVVSAGRGDLASIRSTGLMVLTLLWLGGTRPRLPLATLNIYFLASIVVGGIWFLLGLSDYGLLPGQYSEGADRGIEWRVSLFPFVPESGFLALVVLLANQVHGRGWSRICVCTLALYFVVFSGMRSALVALLLCEIYVALNGKRCSTKARTAQLVFLIVTFAGAIVASYAAPFLPTLPGGVIGNYLFRTETFGDSDAALSQTVYRAWLWLQHLELFLSSPLTGIGTFEFSSVVKESLIEGKDDSGSESFITSWLARLGLCFVPFLVYLWLLVRRAAVAVDNLKGTIVLTFGVASLAYGSFIVPYNFMFIILFCYLLQAVPRNFEPTRRTAL